ncbi:ANTAR domain-containing protein [Streptomyces sp. NPDC096032]|uniref:ANTAR domain-containing protein n=1 Tax=Streptomyces sp. NPDC096032 TaxID=3366070 RepID=UPI0038113B63
MPSGRKRPPHERERRRGEAELLRQIGQLQQALTSRAVIDQAIGVGVVIAYARVQPNQGWEILKEVSQRTNIKLREVAGHLVQWPACTWLPPDIHSALDAALHYCKPSAPDDPPPADTGA